jgi:hypothetical protein
MKRTQIYLDDDLYEALKAQSTIQNKKISEIISDSLKKNFRVKKHNYDKLLKIGGLWADRDFDIDEYIRNLRSGDRLKRLYDNNDE